MTAESSHRLFVRSVRFAPAVMVAVLAAAWPGTASARFTCSSNADCEDAANQCDPGKTPCNDGICSPQSPGADAIGCVLIPNDDKCDDGDFCNGAETCDGKHGCNDEKVPRNCDDGILCTLDSCDPEGNRCLHETRNAKCNDGLYCNGREVCDAEQGCVPGKPPKCGDGIACTTDTCDEANDRCKNVANDSKCSNGVFCDGIEKCSPTEGCQPSTGPNCNDNVACTADTCDENADRCTHVENDSLCNDGQFCNGIETCSPTGCTATPPPNCNDGITCTTDLCNEANDACEHVATNSKCSNGLYCDGNETCHPTLGCQPGTPPNCNDNITCTTDRCVETTDTCQHTVHHERCNDGQYCNGVETCSPTHDCQAGNAPDCSDGIACTNDTCVEATDTCSHTTNDELCDDDLYCNGPEVCDLLLGCHGGVAPDCGDGIACTADVCVEETDTCSHTANNAPCQDSLFCNGTEICDPEQGCTPGTANTCDDGILCTLDQCVESTDSCEHIPDNMVCRDNVYCDGNEICDPEDGCINGAPRVCADALACTTDTCSEPLDKCLFTPNNLLCGNKVIDANCGEECDSGTTTGEQCNNGVDDDGDTLVDCLDPDCANITEAKCVACRLQPPCQPLLNDPAIISFSTGTSRSADAPGAFSFHARLLPLSPVDPAAERFLVTLTNAEGEFFRAELHAYGLVQEGRRYRYVATDRDAVRRDGGIAKLSVVRRMYGGEIGYAFKVLAYGDFSRATLPTMTTHAYLGNDVGYLTATWGGEPGRWVLHPRDYDVP